MKDGTKISFTRRNGEIARGKVVKTENGKTGDWLHIDTFDEKGKPTGKIAKIRPTQATKV